ncbi:MAG: phosphate ABC transporter ATP-binding protein [Candidatus Poribacteria bacterium]|nr:phosphate ABC transporter ATP-binding protein [Candidatus Poribacteria bacterium]
MQSQKTDPILQIHDLNVWYGKSQILKNLTFDVLPRQVTAFIGPSNSGKTTLVRCLNRLNDLNVNFRYTGKILYKGENLYALKLKASKIAQQIGMVFQRPIPFRKSIYENVAYSARLRGIKQPDQLDTIVEESLRKAQLWDEVYKDLHTSFDALSNGQQQRLCIARALASAPEILIFDEPCEQLDAAETPKLEAIVQNLKSHYTLIFVTNKRRQAARVSDVAGFLYNGELVEFGQTEQIFTNPIDKRTENYVTGRLG